MTDKGTILKDSFYKERLTRTMKNIDRNTTNGFGFPQGDSEEQQPSQEQEMLDFKQFLSNLGKTSCGTTFAFRDFNCTYKRLNTIKKISQYLYLQKVDLSYNSLRSLRHLNGLKYLTEIKATNNQLTSVLDTKDPPLHLDILDLSNNNITKITDLSRHKELRVLKLNANKINVISGLDKCKALRVLNLSENVIEEMTGLDGLELRQLYLSQNQIQTVKGLSKLQHLRILNLSINRIKKISGLVNLVSLRELNLSKNNIKHVRQIYFLQHLMYLSNVDFCYNPVQQRKYYRMQVIYKLPMLRQLDGCSLSGEEVVFAESLYGLDVEQKYNIFKKNLPEEEFIDRRIHKSELIEVETDSEGQNNNLVDEYDEEGRRTHSNSKNSRGFNGSKRSIFSKGSKHSKRSSLSKG